MAYIRKVTDESWTYEHHLSETEKAMFYYIQSTGHYYSKPIYCCRRQSLDSILIKYTLNGTGYLKYNDQSYTLNKNDLFIIDCRKPHYYGTSKTDLWEMVWLHFSGGESKRYMQQILEFHGPVFKCEANNRVLRNISQIQRLLKSGNLQINMLASALITEILTELLIKSRFPIENINEPPAAVKQTIRFIEKNYARTISLDQIAAETGFSKYYLSRVFKQYTGKSPYEYLILQRLQASKVLLKNTTYPIHLIGQKVGFDNPSHFIKIFKQYEGTTPLRFRKIWNQL
ncbi:MAG: AraC family transcriptional regulator [Firmicutes bacterium]|nr:AraC family transcriptional regulator [Bacillota bacterium]